jgi:hypothetical protein
MDVIKEKTTKIKETFAFAKRFYRTLPLFFQSKLIP